MSILLNEEVINKLEININNLKQTVDEFDLYNSNNVNSTAESLVVYSQSRSQQTHQKFFVEYINFENKILNLLELITNKGIESDRLSNLMEIFSEYWTSYQDKWSDDYWEIYNNERQSIDSPCFNFEFINHKDCGQNSPNPISPDNIYSLKRDRIGSLDNGFILSEHDLTNKEDITNNVTHQNKTMHSLHSNYRIDILKDDDDNLTKIDDELKEFEKNFRESKPKVTKKNPCFNCCIF